ncbi:MULTISPECIES: transcriptional regulator [unclassified Flavobacterium]|uniref:transcriptional regulator n=1 Tax=unclassified Flavobacterium TaxID=196869 RepID=UPI0025C27CAF|nr:MULTISPECIES: transcriptional regulator [unclassified Flavobacterium]
MNYIKHLTGFFVKISQQQNFKPTHISLYLALFQYWNLNRFQNPIYISRSETMSASKINSKVTYHKCMRELNFLGFIEYFPSFNIYLGTKINMIDFSCEIKSKSKIKPSDSTNFGQANGQGNGQGNVLPYIYNNKTNKNNINIYIEPEFEILDDSFLLENQEKNQNEMLSQFAKPEKKQKEKSSAKKEKVKSVISSVSSRAELRDEKPTLELVKDYFKFQEYSEFEAERFFNYYSSNGWLIGGKTKMIDWKASARNWMLNTTKFVVNVPQNIPRKEQSRAYNLHAVIDKNYAEPL